MSIISEVWNIIKTNETMISSPIYIYRIFVGAYGSRYREKFKSCHGKNYVGSEYLPIPKNHFLPEQRAKCLKQ